MPIMATLEDMSLADLFNVVTLRGATGRLVVERDDHRALLYFERGRLVFVSSATLGQRLGELLVQQGALTEENLRLALDWQRYVGGDTPTLGALLIDQRLITREELERALILQAEQILYEVLVWTTGRLKFRSGAATANATPLPMLNLQRIVLEAVRRADEHDWQTPVIRRIGPDDTVADEGLVASDWDGERAPIAVPVAAIGD